MDPLSAIVVVATTAIICFAVYDRYIREDKEPFDFDVNEGIAPAVDGPIDIEALRKDPSKLETLRGKVTSVVYHSGIGLNSEEPVGESWLIDSNGATVEIEKRKTYNARSLEYRVESRGKTPHERNLEIEESARWLADTLDVPFED